MALNYGTIFVVVSLQTHLSEFYIHVCYVLLLCDNKNLSFTMFHFSPSTCNEESVLFFREASRSKFCSDCALTAGLESLVNKIVTNYLTKNFRRTISNFKY